MSQELLVNDDARASVANMYAVAMGGHRVTHARGYHEYSMHEKLKMAQFESLDFGVCDNQIWREHQRKISHFDHSRKTFGKWFICFWIGVVTGIIAYGIKFCVDEITKYKLDWATSYMAKADYFTPGIIYLLMNVSLVVLSVLVIFFVGPLASGSGIPEVKGYLNGIHISGALNIRTLIGKILSLLLSYSSALFLGPEGPMVHLGGMIGAAVGQMKSKTLGCYPKIFWRYHNDKDRRDFISTGAAAGIAAAFGAPIGGILFSIEEASSFWSRQLTWRTFFGCMVATFTVNLFFQGFGIQIHDYGLLTFGFSRAFLYTYPELLPFAALGLIGGLCGAAFVALAIRLVKWRESHFGQKRAYRMADAVTVIFFTSTVIYVLASLMPCRPLSGVLPPASNGQVCDKVEAKDRFVQMFCPDKYYSDMASLVFVPLDSALNLLFSRSLGVFSIYTIIIYAVLSFFMMIVTTGLWVASGLFVPTMLVGGAIGRVLGELMFTYFNSPSNPIDPSIYAMIGSAALMAGTTRMTISLVVIMIELTEGTQYLLPVILAVMIGKWVGDFFNESVYEHLMELKCFPFLPSQPPRTKSMLTVGDVMNANVVTFHSYEKVSTILNVLQSNSHNGFPVISPTSEGRLLFQGLILRSQLMILLENKIFFKKSTRHFADEGDSNIGLYRPPLSQSNMLSPTNRVYDSRENLTSSSDDYQEISLSKKLDHEEFTWKLGKHSGNKHPIKLTPEEQEMYVDLGPYMNLSPAITKDTTSFSEAYHTFRSMGLRHLVVVNSYVEVAGIITRKDLL